MDLDHEFTVPLPIQQTWSALLDVERIAPCMPGATVDSFDGEEIVGRLKVKLGAMTVTYKGVGRIVSRDEKTYTATIEGQGKEARGAGTANAAVQASLHEEGDLTRVKIHTKLNVTGRPAQFGRSFLAEVGGKLVQRFADCLAEELTSPSPTEEPAVEGAAEATESSAAVPQPRAAAAGENNVAKHSAATGNGSSRGATAAPSTQARPARQSKDDVLDVFELAGPSIAKRAIPVLAGILALLTIRRLVRRRRRRR